ncbi:MAG TPA: FtsX-like permease family protein [Vicinamibacterales bacterium]|nr:FtsX-like permease family protein [Vicinamibacterales bacterium]
MRVTQLVVRGLTHYWRTNLAVVFGVATAVAVLAGALLVGDSVRGSLRDLVLGRLGKTDQVVASAGFFREALAEEIRRDVRFASRFSGVVPLIAARGIVTDQESGRRAGQVAVYGVDDRFWRFHGVSVSGPADREAFISPALAGQLGSPLHASILVRVQRPTDVPLESLHGRKDDVGRTLRLTIAGILPASSLGEFSLEPQQADVVAVFVPLSRLQQEIETAGRVNTLLVSSAGRADAGDRTLEDLVRAHTTLDDFGLTIKRDEKRNRITLGSAGGLLDDRQAAAAEAARGTGMRAQPLMTYLANTLRVGDRETPYSLVTALDLYAIVRTEANDPNDPNDPIVLTDWAASDLHARAGDRLTLEYYAWEEPGHLVTRSAEFRVAGVVPLGVGDRDMAPAFPGISDSPTLTGWDPPFPVDLRRVRPADEQYWKQYRTTPKAYIPLEVGQRLWRSRYGALTSVRLTPPPRESLAEASRAYADRLRAAIDPLTAGVAVRDVRAESLSASRGATDFGEYFVYFSFFLVVSALLLASLFFKLGVEQRVREVGLLRAVGFGPRDVRRLFLGEGLLLAIAGSAIGVIGAIGYAALLMHGLRTWWVDAVGTTALTLHLTTQSLAAGALGGILAAVVCIWWTLRSLGGISERTLLAGDIAAPLSTPGRRRALPVTSAALAIVGVLLLILGAARVLDPAGAFFGAGFALLGATLGAFFIAFRRSARGALTGGAAHALSRLGFRNATYRPGRSVLSMAVIAAATFILISVDAFRRGASSGDTDPHSGLGGYSVMVDTLLPIARDPNTADGREALNLFDLDDSATIEPFRVLPGDDASCLNLYEPRNPRILAPGDAFLEQGRFQFSASLATSDAERGNPWLLLQRTFEDGAVPVIADANSMTYVLHRSLGDEIVLARGGQPLRLRIVAALRDSIFQGELLMSQANFLRLFPEQPGYQFLLVQTMPGRAEAVVGQIENALGDFGADATLTADRLAQFHRVENTYLSTFQTLGGLGLLLGTVGLATVLLRNVLERRRELALLGAVGYRREHFLVMILAENALLLAGGLVTGALCAGLAIAPAVAERGGRVPLSSGGALLLFAVLVTGLLSSVVALRAATRAPLLSSLRSE